MRPKNYVDSHLEQNLHLYTAAQDRLALDIFILFLAGWGVPGPVVVGLSWLYCLRDGVYRGWVGGCWASLVPLGFLWWTVVGGGVCIGGWGCSA